MSITDAFGNRIRNLRLAQGLSQDALADKARLHRTYIGSVERGEKNVTLLSANRIAEALGVTLSECLQGIEDEYGFRD